MEIILINLCRTVLFSFVFSVILGIIFSFMSEFTPNKFKASYTFFKDTLSIILFFIFFILILYYFNNGEYRWYYLLAFILGAFSYKICLSRVIGGIINILINPFKAVIKYIVQTIRKLYCFFVHTIAKLRKKMYNKNTHLNYRKESFHEYI